MTSTTRQMPVLASGILVSMLSVPLLASAQTVDSTQTRVASVPSFAVGMVLGAVGGIATGFAIARGTDYALEEGGAYGVILLGSLVGMFVGGRIAASIDNPWAAGPGRIQLALRYARTATGAGADIRAPMQAARFSPTSQYHAIAPSAMLSYRFAPRVDAGVEVSGIAARRMRAVDSDAAVAEEVTGVTYSLVARYTGAFGRLVYGAGGGLDRYRVTVLSYFDPSDQSYPNDQPARSATSNPRPIGLQVRGNLGYYVVRDALIEFGVSGRAVGDIEVAGIRLHHPNAARIRSLASHRVNLSSLHATAAVALHF